MELLVTTFDRQEKKVWDLISKMLNLKSQFHSAKALMDLRAETVGMLNRLDNLECNVQQTS